LVLSLVVGILAGYYKVVAALLNPAMILLRTIPTVSLILILLIWFGRDLGPTIIVGLVIFPIIYELVVGSIKKV
ncbi:ABC transporter permease, partial [Acinetobacter baumannii]